MMPVFKKYLLAHFEQVFVLMILLGVNVIVYFIPYKLAFLSFFFIPVLLAASYLGTRQALLGALFSVVVVSGYAIVFPEKFYTANVDYDVLARIIVWGGFLMLSGAVVGYLNQQLKEKILEASKVHSDLDQSNNLLNKTTAQLIEFTENFEEKVANRTSVLEKSKNEIERHNHKVEEALYATMDPGVVKLIIENRLRTEKRRISILFCDLVNFTLYSEQLHAEVVIADLNRYLASMETILLLYHAHIDKYVGDGIMAEFGAPIARERSTLMSVVAALKMQQQLKRDNFPWKMRIGIATGEPIIGLIGHQRRSYTALGDVVNLASRIESLCDPGQVSIDQETYEEIKDFFDVEAISVGLTGPKTSASLLASIEKEQRVWQLQGESVSQAKILGQLLAEAGLYAQARDFYRTAIELDRSDQQAKIKFSELSLQCETHMDVPIKGRKKSSLLYRVKSICNPLYNTDKVPSWLFEKYFNEVSRLVHYPEDIVLPVECLDGCLGHSRLVGFLAYIMADLINLPDQDKRNILEAGYLADIGKSIIPHHLLNRRGRLDGEELNEVRKHPIEAVRKLQKMGYQNNALFDIIAGHHENYDGSGYPNKRAGDAIPIGARIIAICEAYSAMTSWRPYREKWQSHAAISELEQQARNGKFDLSLMRVLKYIIVDTRSEKQLQQLIATVTI
jgi:adenylate cyclase